MFRWPQSCRRPFHRRAPYPQCNRPSELRQGRAQSRLPLLPDPADVGTPPKESSHPADAGRWWAHRKQKRSQTVLCPSRWPASAVGPHRRRDPAFPHPALGNPDPGHAADAPEHAEYAEGPDDAGIPDDADESDEPAESAEPGRTRRHDAAQKMTFNQLMKYEEPT